MELADIDNATFAELDTASGGVLSVVQAFCSANGCTAHLTIQTHLDGLEPGQMKLFITVVKNGDVIDYAVMNMRGPVKKIGWNLYLHDILTSVRAALSRVAV